MRGWDFEPRFTCKSKELSSLVGIPNLGVLVADTVEITPPKKRATSIHFQTGQAGDLALFSIKSKDRTNLRVLGIPMKLGCSTGRWLSSSDRYQLYLLLFHR